MFLFVFIGTSLLTVLALQRLFSVWVQVFSTNFSEYVETLFLCYGLLVSVGLLCNLQLGSRGMLFNIHGMLPIVCTTAVAYVLTHRRHSICVYFSLRVCWSTVCWTASTILILRCIALHFPDVFVVTLSILLCAFNVSADLKRLMVVSERMAHREERFCVPLITETVTCSICWEVVDAEQALQPPTCVHIFHQQCLREWARYKTNCPLCRVDFAWE